MYFKELFGAGPTKPRHFADAGVNIPPVANTGVPVYIAPPPPPVSNIPPPVNPEYNSFYIPPPQQTFVPSVTEYLPVNIPPPTSQIATVEELHPKRPREGISSYDYDESERLWEVLEESKRTAAEEAAKRAKLERDYGVVFDKKQAEEDDDDISLGDYEPNFEPMYPEGKDLPPDMKLNKDDIISAKQHLVYIQPEDKRIPKEFAIFVVFDKNVTRDIFYDCLRTPHAGKFKDKKIVQIYVTMYIGTKGFYEEDKKHIIPIRKNVSIDDTWEGFIRNMDGMFSYNEAKFHTREIDNILRSTAKLFDPMCENNIPYLDYHFAKPKPTKSQKKEIKKAEKEAAAAATEATPTDEEALF